ncbi:MAG: hypothetical protein CM15mP128_1300 [Methanobacteriota archaeon]|nr:MAG: hypothetical protein CM15mP128_1300 [Euryarchaeota archaeon]
MPNSRLEVPQHPSSPERRFSSMACRVSRARLPWCTPIRRCGAIVCRRCPTVFGAERLFPNPKGCGVCSTCRMRRRKGGRAHPGRGVFHRSDSVPGLQEVRAQRSFLPEGPRPPSFSTTPGGHSATSVGFPTVAEARGFGCPAARTKVPKRDRPTGAASHARPGGGRALRQPPRPERCPSKARKPLGPVNINWKVLGVVTSRCGGPLYLPLGLRLGVSPRPAGRPENPGFCEVD